MYTDSKKRTWRILERENGSVSIYYTTEDSPAHYVVFDTLDADENKNDIDASPSRKASRDELLKLIQHCWLYSGYKNCGYKNMTTKQKKLFNSIIGTDIE